MSGTLPATDVIEFETGRLRLRQWRPADRETFARLNADTRVMEFFPASLDRAASDAMADRLEAQIAERGWGFWAVDALGGANFIGFVGLHVPVPDIPCSPCVDVGWRLAFEHWSRGYATEAARGALQVGFERLDLSEIVSFTALQNRRSRAVMERLHMRETGETFEHPNVPFGNPLRAHRLYRLPRERWQREGDRPVLRWIGGNR
jgi:RimJ/RimL family protein N-acetyltransferase